MTKPNDDNSKEVNYLLTHRRGYLERLLADIEAGNIQLSDHEDMNTERNLEFAPSGRVWIPLKVWEGLEQIRQEGQIRMADLDALRAEAERREMHEVVTWVIANPVAMMTAIIKGAEAKEDES